MRVLVTPVVTTPLVASLLAAAARPFRPLVALLGATVGRSAMLFTLIGTTLLFVPLFLVPREALAVIAAAVVVASLSAGLTIAALRSSTITPLLGLAVNASLLATLAVGWLLLGALWAIVLFVLAPVVGAAVAGPPRGAATVASRGPAVAAGPRDSGVYFAIGCIGLLVLLFLIFVVVSWVTQFTPEG